MKKFITDMGHNLVAVSDDGQRVVVPRYAVWGVRKEHFDGVLSMKAKTVVVDVSRDLSELLQQHGNDIHFFRMDDLEAEGETA